MKSLFFSPQLDRCSSLFTNSFILFSDIDCSFFLVTADLWSADGKREMNLVLHPTSSDRYITTHVPKRRRQNAPLPPANPPGDHHNSAPTSSSPSSSKYMLRPAGDVQVGFFLGV